MPVLLVRHRHELVPAFGDVRHVRTSAIFRPRPVMRACTCASSAIAATITDAALAATVATVANRSTTAASLAAVGTVAHSQGMRCAGRRAVG